MSGKRIATLIFTALAASLVTYFLLNYFHRPPGDLHVVIATFFAGVATLLGGIAWLLYAPAFRIAIATRSRGEVFWPIAALSAFLIFSIALGGSHRTVELAPGRTADVPDWSIPASPGTVYVVLLSLVTLVGFVVTISRLEEIHGRMLNYDHLIERCTHLVALEKARVDQHKPGRVLLLANAPAFGNVSAPTAFNKFCADLCDLLRRDIEVKIACKNWNGTPSDIEKFYDEKWPNLPKRADRLEENRAILAAADTRSAIERRNPPPRDIFTLPAWMEEVPYHIFMVSERAILFIALSYPGEAEAKNPRAQPVSIIAYETGDRHIMTALERGFDERFPPKTEASPAEKKDDGGVESRPANQVM